MKAFFRRISKMNYYSTEAYNTLSTNLQFCGDDIHVVMITSCTPNEGKSSVSMNLCRSLAQNGKKVVLLDADLRKSVFVGRYGITVGGDDETELHNIKGLSHYLTGQAEINDVLYETNIDNLSCILAGPVVPNPTQTLGNHYFSELIQHLREEFDMIIIDAPPLGVVIDAAIISKVVDGALLLIQNDHVNAKYAQRVKKQLETAECRVLGAILNKVDKKEKKYYSGQYKGYY